MIAIVTDTSAGFTKKEAQELGIHVVPMTYNVSDQLYFESFSDENGDFESLIFKNPYAATTSQVSSSAFYNVFEELVNKDYQVICLVISSRLSGTYSSACLAARELGCEKVAVIDSLLTVGALRILTQKALQRANKGLSLNEIVAQIEQEKENDTIGISFTVDNMDALRRSGRLGIVKQSVGTILNLRPILVLKDGAIVFKSISRGKADQIRELVNTIPDSAAEVIIHYLEQTKNLEDLIKVIKNKFPDMKISTSKLGPVLSIHLGNSVLGISWTK